MRRLIAVLIVVIPLLAWGGCSIVANRAANEAAAAPWPLQLGSLRDVPSRYPKRNASPAALALGPLEARLGIRLNRFDKRPVTNEERAFSLVKAPLAEWLDQQRASGRDVVAPPPPAVARFLDEHRADVDAIRDHVLANEDAIEWPVDFTRLLDAPLPNLLAHFSVTRCLAAAALRSGDWTYLHAAWILTRVTLRRPEVISSIVAIATTRGICSAACRMPSAAPAWFDELVRFDYRHSTAAAEQADAYLFFAKTTTDFLEADTAPRKFFQALLRPAASVWAADLANRERAIVEHFAPFSGCAVDGDAFDRQMKAAVPKFHTYSKAVLPPWGMTWQRVERLRAELELTQRVLILKSRGWPAAAPDLATSQCAGDSWNYANGELRFSREIAAKGGAFPLHMRR